MLCAVCREGLLDNPAIFSPTIQHDGDGDGDGDGDDASSSSGGGAERSLALALEYVELAGQHGPVPMKCAIFHVRRMAKTQLTRYQLMQECCAAASLPALQQVVAQCLRYVRGERPFVYEPLKEQRAQRALETRRLEEGKRKAYEGRMQRKAKREGKPPGFYLQHGAANPTVETLQRLRALPADEAFAWWKEHHAQHCHAFHFGGCKRERGCAFLHADPSFVDHAATLFG